MTAVSFHVNVGDTGAYVCRLVRKAYNSGAPVLLVGNSRQIRQIDELLWTFSGPDFVPHSGPDEVEPSPQGSFGRPRPVCLSTIQPVRKPAHPQEILINIGVLEPQGYEQFARVFDIVGDEEAEKSAGRTRWKAYKAAGCELSLHDRHTVMHSEPPQSSSGHSESEHASSAAMTGAQTP